jgi:hypothetical protein
MVPGCCELSMTQRSRARLARSWGDPGAFLERSQANRRRPGYCDRVVVAGSTLRRYQLLGDVRAYEGDTALSLGASKPRSLLAILLLRAGSVVPTDVACDLLWSGRPPRSAATTLHGYVSGLRRALGRESIRTESPGYSIHLD